MVSLQILSKVINTKDNSIIEDNALTQEYFPGYADEFNFIQDHIRTYGNVPDAETFFDRFPKAELVEVTETDDYLLDKLLEEHLYMQSVPVIQKAAELLQTDSNAAAEYLNSQMKELQPNYKVSGLDIVAQAEQRFEQFKETQSHVENYFFESGFKELDDITHGLKRAEEFFFFFSRTNQGKSWVLEKICTHVWGLGFNVGYVSPEMGASSIGFRFDTLFGHYSNKSLTWGNKDVDDNSYAEYIQKLKEHKNKFIVGTPSKDFQNNLTVSKLRNWIKKFKLDLIAIDGITYMSDERYKRGDNKTTSLTNISEDLMSLSVEMNVPVLVVVQANRGGVAQDDDGTPELEHIRDSDGISYNASKVISIRQKKDNILEIGIKKNRDGKVGGKLNYTWNIDTGEFAYIPGYDDAKSKTETDERVKKGKQKYEKDNTSVF